MHQAEFMAGRWIGLMFAGRMEGWIGREQLACEPGRFTFLARKQPFVAGARIAGAQSFRQLHVEVTDRWSEAVLATGGLDPQLARLLDDPRAPARFATGRLPARLWAACGELLEPGLEGRLRAPVAEVRALDLVAVIAAVLAGGRERRSVLRPRDVERLHEVRAILDAEFADPPTLLELARRAGLNLDKLKRGFKELFASPVAAYVIERRVERARRLIEEERFSVAQAAYAVGYTPAHLSVAFRRRFKIAPSLIARQR